MIIAFVQNRIALQPLLQCSFARWQPKVGDPSLVGWLTVAAYLVTMVLCVLVFRRLARRPMAVRLFWLTLSALMLFLAINKQLDLQSFATALARCIAKAQGWYDQRQSFQLAVIITIAISAGVGALGFLWLLRHHLKRNILALCGLALVLGFVVIRMAGFHQFDVIVNFPEAVFRLNRALELSGPALISANAIVLLKFRPAHH
ncbi:MAG: isopropylmalate isomerase [Paracoccaceae bacterium]